MIHEMNHNAVNMTKLASNKDKRPEFLNKPIKLLLIDKPAN
jgi:hypothetical protein